MKLGYPYYYNNDSYEIAYLSDYVLSSVSSNSHIFFLGLIVFWFARFSPAKASSLSGADVSTIPVKAPNTFRNRRQYYYQQAPAINGLNSDLNSIDDTNVSVPFFENFEGILKDEQQITNAQSRYIMFKAERFYILN